MKCRRGHRPCEWPVADGEVSAPGDPVSPAGPPSPKRQKVSSSRSRSPSRLAGQVLQPAGSVVHQSDGRSVTLHCPQGAVTIFTATRIREMFEEMEQLMDWIDSDYEPEEPESDGVQSAGSGADSMEEGLEDEAREAARWTCIEDVEKEYKEHRRSIRRIHTPV